MFEVDEAAKIITESIDRDANIIFGTTINDDYTWEIKITVVATWFDEDTNKNFSHNSVVSKVSPFWRKNILDSRPQQNVSQSREQIPPSQDDLDIPAFLRKKI